MASFNCAFYCLLGQENNNVVKLDFLVIAIWALNLYGPRTSLQKLFNGLKLILFCLQDCSISDKTDSISSI